MIEVVSYADKHRKFENAEHLLGKSCKKNGADSFYGYKRENLPKDLQNLCKEQRGGGYWRWKSWIICNELNKLNDGDYLAYFDAGCILVNNIHFLIACMERDNQQIMLFSQTSDLIERNWTKRDVFIALGCDDRTDIIDSPQTYGGYLVIKNTEYTRKFAKEYYNNCVKGSLITDKPNKLGKPNYEGFVENRHDQSILSVMAKKEGIKPYRDPSQYSKNGVYSDDVLGRSTFPVMIFSHRLGYVKYYWQLYFVESDFYKKKLPKYRLIYKLISFIMYRIP